jgi:hypothetical protein
MTEEGGTGHGLRLRTVISALVSIALVVAVFWFFLPQFTSISAVWSSIRAMTWLEIATLVLAAIWNLVTYLLVNVATMRPRRAPRCRTPCPAAARWASG